MPTAIPKILIIGGRGMLAERLRQRLTHVGAVIHAPGKEQLDITDDAAVARALADMRPDLVINAAAFLNTERCEADPASSYAVNSKAAGVLARLVGLLPDTRLVQFSTDFVFDGIKGGYAETDVVRPLSYYGLHKALADEAIQRLPGQNYILRIASVIGAPLGKRDFIRALTDRIAKGVTHLDVNDEFEISLSTTGLVCDAVAEIAAGRIRPGLYHCAARGRTTWHQVATRALQRLGHTLPINPVPASAYPLPTPRPPKSWMLVDKLAAQWPALPDWQTALDRQIDVLRQETSVDLSDVDFSRPLAGDPR